MTARKLEYYARAARAEFEAARRETTKDRLHARYRSAATLALCAEDFEFAEWLAMVGVLVTGEDEFKDIHKKARRGLAR